MKAKSLHFSKSGNVQPIASEIGRVMQCVCDQIPPAYPCEGEKVVLDVYKRQVDALRTRQKLKNKDFTEQRGIFRNDACGCLTRCV